jgi:phosphoacetylglucosamine mutase
LPFHGAGVKFSYGTAGFRTDATLLPSTIFRMGVLAALRSICTQAITGLMITASHNPVHENGVKLVDPSGGMLAVSWESYSDLLANAPEADDFIQVCSKHT